MQNYEIVDQKYKWYPKILNIQLFPFVKNKLKHLYEKEVVSDLKSIFCSRR